MEIKNNIYNKNETVVIVESWRNLINRKVPNKILKEQSKTKIDLIKDMFSNIRNINRNDITHKELSGKSGVYKISFEDSGSIIIDTSVLSLDEISKFIKKSINDEGQIEDASDLIKRIRRKIVSKKRRNNTVKQKVKSRSKNKSDSVVEIIKSIDEKLVNKWFNNQKPKQNEFNLMYGQTVLAVDKLKKTVLSKLKNKNISKSDYEKYKKISTLTESQYYLFFIMYNYCRNINEIKKLVREIKNQ
jgi:hypothetical protein